MTGIPSRRAPGRLAAIAAVALVSSTGWAVAAEVDTASAADVPRHETPLATPAVPEPPAAAVAASSEARAADPDELRRLAREDVAALGPLSIGSPDSGLLVNPVPMPEGARWTVRDLRESFGTTETIEFITVALELVEKQHPGSPRLLIGDMSRPDGGRLGRHRSHQTGRDVDLGFYYRKGENARFEPPRKGDLDLPRTWSLLHALLTQTDVEFIFLDRSLMRVFYSYALEAGEDRAWLDDVFGRLGAERKGIVQHERKHKDHMHVRFFNRGAQERGRIVYATLVETGAVPPPTTRCRVHAGDTLGGLARRYGVGVAAIRAANGLHGTGLRAGRSYLIPLRRVPADSGPIVFPARRLPPAPVASVARAVAAPPPAEASAGLDRGVGP